MGDKLAVVAFPWLIYRATGSPIATGLMFAFQTLPYLLFGAIAGVAIDRFNKRTLMIAADIVRAILVLLVPVVATRSLTGVYALSFLIATGTVLFDPAEMSLLPDIVSERQLLRANSVLATGFNLTEIAGYSAAGYLLAFVSIGSAFRIDAITFVVSGAALAAMRYAAPARQTTNRAMKSVRRDLREGLRYMRRHRGLLMNTLMVCGSAAGMGATFSLSLLLAVRVFDGDTRTFGQFGTATAIGFLIGSVSLTAVAGRVRKGLAMTIGIATMGVSLAAIAVCSTVWQACIVFVVFGLANAIALITIDTYLQGAVPESLRGRVFGVRFMLTQGIFALSALAGGALTAIISVPVLFIVSGVIVAVPALMGIAVRDIRDA